MQLPSAMTLMSFFLHSSMAPGFQPHASNIPNTFSGGRCHNLLGNVGGVITEMLSLIGQVHDTGHAVNPFDGLLFRIDRMPSLTLQRQRSTLFILV
jgi:hypothetical protein